MKDSREQLYPNYNPFPVCFTKGQGSLVYDEEGNEYIDLISGIAVNSVGHCHPEVIAALEKQAQQLWHVSNLFQAPWQEKLAEKMLELSKKEGTRLSHVFFCNSGTEANEAALKLVRFYGQSISKKKFKVVSLYGSFHGRSMGSACLTGQKKGQEEMGPLPEGFLYTDANDMAALEDIFTDEVCAFFMEPVQGEGGVLPLSREFAQRARELCDQHKAVLVSDEVQIGAFRSGSFWAYQRLGIEADLVTTAKGIGGGFPIGAMLSSSEFSTYLKPGTHGSTFGGNALACAVSQKVLEVLDHEKAGERALQAENFIQTRMEALRRSCSSAIESFRGKGLLWGIVLKEELKSREVVEALLKRGISLGAAGPRVLRIAPSLLIEKSTLERAFDEIEACLKEL